MSLKPKRVNFTDTWTQIEDTIRGVITLEKVPRNVWNDRFSDVYSLCVSTPESFADRLYESTKSFLEEHVRGLLNQVEVNDDASLLNSYYSFWKQYSSGLEYLHKLYSYLNLQYIRKNHKPDGENIFGHNPEDDLVEIGELGLNIWKNIMVTEVKDTLIPALISEIQFDRLKLPLLTSSDVVKGIVHSLVDIEQFQKNQPWRTYQFLFEKPFLDATGEYYMGEAIKLLQSCNVSQYMEKVTSKIHEETIRCHQFIHYSSHAAVRARCEAEMVYRHLSFLHSECKLMVQEERIADLRNMYPLLNSVSGGIGVLIQYVNEHIKSKGLAVVDSLQGDNIHVQFVENVLEIYFKYKELIFDVFANDQNFISALDKACTAIINYRITSNQPSKSAELLARYCDMLLKKSSRTLPVTEVETKLSNSIIIFKYIDDKDIFQKFYSRMLARRLIHQLSQSMDAEEAMIDRLKLACGYEFTNKLHRMFTDISISCDLNNKFSNFLRSNDSELGVGFSIYVLQTGAWPLGQTVITPFNPPAELIPPIQLFEQFYNKNFNGRKLTWLHHLCQGELKVAYLKKIYLITMQTYQLSIMLLFETVNSLTYGEIRENLQISPEIFSKHVFNLIENKLVIGPSTIEELNDSTVLSLNFDFSHKRMRLKFSGGQVSSSNIGAMGKEASAQQQQESDATVASVEEDRKLYLQATIVRIMKDRKVLKHTALIQEVLSQSKTFAPTIPMIKQCIESLIDKQYIERTPNSTEEYSYVA